MSNRSPVNESLSNSSTISLPKNICQNREELKSFLRPYYLGEPKEYLLIFDPLYVSIIDSAFDALIKENGVRDVFFYFPTQSFSKKLA